jgi:hypothetical protein
VGALKDDFGNRFLAAHAFAARFVIESLRKARSFRALSGFDLGLLIVSGQRHD